MTNHSTAKCIVMKLTKLIGMASIARKNGIHDGFIGQIDIKVLVYARYNYENSAKSYTKACI